MRYYVRITDGPQGGGYTSETTNKRKAMKACRAEVESRYENQTEGHVETEDGTRLAAWVNEGGRAVRVNT